MHSVIKQTAQYHKTAKIITQAVIALSNEEIIMGLRVYSAHKYIKPRIFTLDGITVLAVVPVPRHTFA